VVTVNETRLPTSVPRSFRVCSFRVWVKYLMENKLHALWNGNRNQPLVNKPSEKGLHVLGKLYIVASTSTSTKYSTSTCTFVFKYT